MAPEKRQSGTSIAESLFEEFFSFSFFKAVSILETMFPKKRPLGETLTPDREAVRFFVRPGFAFPPSDISNLEYSEDGDHAEMDVSFMGLIGPNGILPNWYNELALERNYHKDFTLTAFMDMFHHRLISMFYLAWKKHRFPENYQPGATDRLSVYLLSLCGLGTKGLSRMIGLPHESLVFYSGLLSRLAPAAVAIENAVSYLSGTEVRVDQFVEQLIPIEPEDQTRVGSANSRLGMDTVCGGYVWDCQSRFRVNLGPMGYEEFLRFIPSGDLLRPIFFLIKYMVGTEYEFEIRVILKREDVPPCELGSSLQPRLGWTAWIKHPEFVHKENPYITFHQDEL